MLQNGRKLSIANNVIKPKLYKQRMTKNKEKKYKTRFSKNLGGESYEDIRIIIKYFDRFQADVGRVLRGYVKKYCKNLAEIAVLEIGSGTGITTLQILETDPRVKVVSVDNESRMLEIAKYRIHKMRKYQRRVNFILSDALQYLESYKDNSFDAFVSVLTLHNLKPDFRKKVIKQISKKIKPGGVFINGDKYIPSKAYCKTYLRNEIKDFNNFDVEARKAEKRGDTNKAKYLYQIKKEWTEHALQDDKNHITVKEQNKLFEELGFINVEWIKKHELVAIVKAVKK